MKQFHISIFTIQKRTFFQDSHNKIHKPTAAPAPPATEALATTSY